MDLDLGLHPISRINLPTCKVVYQQNKKSKIFFHRFFRCSGLLTFRQYIEENRWQSPTQKELASVKRAIRDTQDKIFIIRMKRLLFRKKDELSTLEQEPPPKYPFLPK